MDLVVFLILLIYSRVAALPLFHLFAVLPIACLPVHFNQSLLNYLLISFFLLYILGAGSQSTSSQAAQIDPNEFVSIL